MEGFFLLSLLQQGCSVDWVNSTCFRVGFLWSSIFVLFPESTLLLSLPGSYNFRFAKHVLLRKQISFLTSGLVMWPRPSLWMHSLGQPQWFWKVHVTKAGPIRGMPRLTRNAEIMLFSFLDLKENKRRQGDYWYQFCTTVGTIFMVRWHHRR